MDEEIKSGSWPEVTIAIPTYNGMAWLKESIPDFLAQNYPGKFNLLIIDSGSQDGTAELDASYPQLQIHRINQDEFGHGRTRNLATKISNAELIQLTVQDARPRNSEWLFNMVQALVHNNLDAVCGGQAVPHDADKNPIEWYRPESESTKVRVIDGLEFKGSTPVKQMGQCGWDNVNALYRRMVLEDHPFQDVRFGEDMLWAKDWLEKGGRIGYAYSNKVWHYHHHNADYTRKRELNTLYWRWKVFGCKPPLLPFPSWRYGLTVLKVLVLNSKIYSPKKLLYWWKYNWKKAKNAASAGQEFKTHLSQGTKNLEHLYESLGSNAPMAKR